MRLVAGLDVLWREAGASQVGSDPRCAVVVEDLTAAEQRLLEALDWSPTVADLRRRGSMEGLARARVDRLVDLLVSAGVVTDLTSRVSGSRETGRRASGDGSTGDTHWRERLTLVASSEVPPRTRTEAIVGVIGLGRTGALTAVGLAAAGVGTLLVSDPGPVLSTDVLPYRSNDVGHPRETRLVHDLRTAVPSLRVAAPSGTRPDLMVVVTHKVSDPPLLRRLGQEDVPHVVVVVGELSTVVGPVVRPGSGGCVRCLDLARTELDRSWPAVATQLRILPEATESYTQAAWAAATAVRAALRLLDRPEAPHPLAGASLELDPGGTEVRRQWPVHDRCGCAGPDGAGGSGTSGDPETPEGPGGS